MNKNNQEKKSQKLPNIPKKKNILTEHDKQNIKDYYSQLQNFYNENNIHLNNSLINTKYICIKDDNNEYYIDNYDKQKFFDFGIIKNKKLYVCLKEIFYLNQIGLLNIKNFDINDITCNNINLLNLYCYLKRNGKIIKCLEFYKDDLKNITSLENYLLIYNNKNEYNSNKISNIIYNFSSDLLNYNLINLLLKNSQTILNFFSSNNSSLYEDEQDLFLLAITQGTSITFLSIKELTTL